MLLDKIAKQFLFISRMPKLCAILQLLSAPLCVMHGRKMLKLSHQLANFNMKQSTVEPLLSGTLLSSYPLLSGQLAMS